MLPPLQHYVPGKTRVSARDMNALIDGMHRADGFSVAPPLEMIKTKAGVSLRIKRQTVEDPGLKHPFRGRIDPDNDKQIQIGIDRDTTLARSDFISFGQAFVQLSTTDTIDLSSFLPLGAGAAIFVYYDIKDNPDLTPQVSNLGLLGSTTFKSFEEGFSGVTGIGIRLDVFGKFRIIAGVAIVNSAGTAIGEWRQTLFEFINIREKQRAFSYNESSRILTLLFSKPSGGGNPNAIILTIPTSTNTVVFIELSDFTLTLSSADIAGCHIKTDGTGKLIFLVDFISVLPNLYPDP